MYLNRQKYKKQQCNRQLHKAQQQGFVLILVLVMLAVLTLIGVSSMNSANMELKATANARQHQAAFHVTQSVLEFAVSADGAALIDFQINDSTQTQTIDENSEDFSVSGSSDYSASAVFVGCGVGVGSSLEKGFSFNFFDITGTGTNAVGTGTSVQVQGIRFPAAAC